MSDTDHRLIHVVLDEHRQVRRSAEAEHERAVAVHDLLEENSFRPAGDFTGPYMLRLRQEENRMVFDIRDAGDNPLREVHLSLTPFKKIIKDYFEICESYYDAIKRLSPSQIEAIDMGRRGLHNEGSETLKERLSGKIEVDSETARRLFTLMCVLQIRG